MNVDDLGKDPNLQAAAPVSVVIPCFRCADTIGDAVASVAAQTLLPAEILLVDDCSGDGTVDALRALAADHPPGWIKVIELATNGGPSAARNTGWNRAGQEYIAFLDADDTWAPRKLELQMAALRADPDIALIAHRMDVRARNLPPPTLQLPARTSIIGRRQVLLYNPFPTASVVLRRDLPQRFDENFRRVEDFLLWVQISGAGHRCAKINQTLASWHKPNYGAGGLSGDMQAMRKAGRKVRKELVRQGLMTRPEYYFTRVLSIFRRTHHNLVLWIRRLRSNGARSRVSP